MGPQQPPGLCGVLGHIFLCHTGHVINFSIFIFLGDLNIEPTDLGYRVITVNAGLIDAWLMKPVSFFFLNAITVFVSYVIFNILFL